MRVSPVVFGLQGSTIVLASTSLNASIMNPQKQFAAVLVVAAANTISDSFAVSAAKGGVERFEIDRSGFLRTLMGEVPPSIVHTVFAYLIQEGYVHIFNTAFLNTLVISILLIFASILVIAGVQYRIIKNLKQAASSSPSKELSPATMAKGTGVRFAVVIAVVAFVVSVTFGLDKAIE